MNIIFCNIDWMKYYNGITPEDMPKHEGQIVKDTSDVFEKDNFSDFNGRCYGYVRSAGSITLEKHFRGIPQGIKSADGFMIVWCAAIDSEEMKIVGWYKNARVYRDLVNVPLFEDEYLNFNFMADAKDCYLLPEEERTFTIKKTKSRSASKGAIKSNIWYAKSEYAQSEFVPRVRDFIEYYEGSFVHFQVDDALLHSLPLDEDNASGYDVLMDKGGELYEEQKAREAIPYFNAARKVKETYDVLFSLAQCYYDLNAFKISTSILEEAMEKFGETKEAVELAFICSDYILHREKAMKYFRKLNEYDNKVMTEDEYMDYDEELAELIKLYSEFI